jgi:anti-sigma factor RsiW
MGDPVVRREELESALAARHELGRDYEREIVDSLVERIERRLDERERQPSRPPVRRERSDHRSVTPLALGSIALGIPVTAISTGNGDPWLAVVAWIAIAVINVAYAFRR